MKELSQDLSESIKIPVFLLVFFKQKILDALVLALERRKSHRESRGELGNDIFQFGSISPIIILILNFSPAHSMKNH